MKKKILFVDATGTRAGRLARNLKVAGYSVETAETSTQADTMILLQSPDLIICSDNLDDPEKGYTGARYVKFLRQGTWTTKPIIFISMHKRHHVDLDFSALSIDFFKLPPENAEKLIEAVSRVLAR